MKELFTKLITSGSGISSKRFISLAGLILLFVMVVANLCGLEVSSDLIWGVISIILGSGTQTLFENKKGDVNNTPPFYETR
jgi:hypothetical protein